jgi:hypothetical protein
LTHHDPAALTDRSRGSEIEKVPSGEAGFAPQPTGTKELVAYFVREVRFRADIKPPKRVVGQMARQIKALQDEGIDPATLRRAVKIAAEKGLNPSTLPNVVIQAAREGKRGRRYTAADMAREDDPEGDHDG